MYKLQAHEYGKIRHLYAALPLALVSEAVIAGNSPAAIWVDSDSVPRTALLWDKTHCLYLAGDTDSEASNRAVCELIAEELLNHLRQLGIFKVYYASSDWEDHISTLFPGVSLTQRARVLHTLGQLNVPDWRGRVPDGFSVQPIDQTLLANPSLKNVQNVREEIESCWPSLQLFFDKGFGFCLVHDDEAIACWCTAEYVSEGKCGIGIETVEAYQRRGFATLTAAAFVAHCLSQRIAPHWDAWASNLPSLAVAEKVGFLRTHEYSVYLGTSE